MASRMGSRKISQSDDDEKRNLFVNNQLDKSDWQYGWFVEEQKYVEIFANYFTGKDVPKLGFFTRKLTETSRTMQWNLIVFRPGTSYFFTKDRSVRTILVPYPNTSRFAWPIVFIEFDKESHADADCRMCFLDSRAPCAKFSAEAQKNRASELFKLMQNVTPLENFEIGSGKKQKGTFQARRNSLKNQCVQTPRLLYETLDAIFHFDHDPCPVSGKFDAMQVDWGSMNYVNPPFEVTAGFAFRASELAIKKNTKTVLICPVATNSRWFTELAKTGTLLAVIFLREGLTFQGYNKSMGLHMNLLLIGRPPENSVSESGRTGPFVWQIDTEKNKKRVIRTSFEHLPLPLYKIGW